MGKKTAKDKKSATVENKTKSMKDITQKGMDHFADFAHNVFLAGLGGISLAQEEVEKFTKKLVERGQITEKDGVQLVKKIMKKTDRNRTTIEDKIDAAIQKILPKLNLPEKTDIRTLEEKIDTLARAIDKLTKTKN